VAALWTEEELDCATPPDDLADRIDLVRLLIVDLDSANQMYTDPQISEFLESECWETRLAAAEALDSYATHIAQVAGPIRGLLDIRIGGEQSAAVLRGRADRLRSRVVYAI
jgi:hypothetical protein